MPKHSSTDSHVRSMSGVHARPVEWLWPGWIPLGKLTVLDGDPGVGKSTLLLDLAARLSRDGVMPDGARGPLGAALVLSAEDGEEDTIRPRLAAAGAVLERICTLPAVRDEDGETRPPEIPLDLPVIDAAVRQFGARLLVIDPLMAYLTGADASVDQEVRRALFKLSRLAERRRLRRGLPPPPVQGRRRQGGLPRRRQYRHRRRGAVRPGRRGRPRSARPAHPGGGEVQPGSCRRGRCVSPWKRPTASAGCAGWARRTSRPTSWCGG